MEPLEDGGFRVSARLHVEDLGELFEMEIRGRGRLRRRAARQGAGHRPVAGDEVEVAGLHRLADEVDGHRITAVVVHRSEPEPDAGEDAARATRRAGARGAQEEKAQRKREKRERKERERSATSRSGRRDP